jgi:diguanylate cyclase (GGDEF)-like protein
MDPRVKILDQAQQMLGQGGKNTGSNLEDLQNLLDLLTRAIELSPEIKDKQKVLNDLGKNLIDDQNLLLLLKQKTDELNALRRISFNLTSRLEFKAVLETVVSEAMNLIKNTDEASIFLYDEGKLLFGADLVSKGEQDKAGEKPLPNGFTAMVARQKKMIVIEDIKAHPLHNYLSRRKRGSIIGIPLVIGTHVVGVMNLVRTIEGGFTEDEIRLIGLLADQAAVAIFNAGRHEEASQEARRDSLTGLPNRRALDERLEVEVKRASRSGTHLAVVMMDLDGFKMINDTFGHVIGDQVLCQAFGPLPESLRSTDFLARYGGDELTIVLPDTDLESARLVIEKVQDKLRKTDLEISGSSKVHLDVSGGIAIYPQHGIQASDLLRAADEALYRAKRRQRSSFLVASGQTAPLINIK